MEEQKQEETVKRLGGEEEEHKLESESESESVQALPSDAVKELLSEGVSFSNSSSFSCFSSAECYFTSHHRYARVASFASLASMAASMLLLLPSLLSPPPHINFAHFASGFCSSRVIQTTPKRSFKITTSHFSLLTQLNDTPISSIPSPLKFPSHQSFSTMITLFGNKASLHFTSFYFVFAFLYSSLLLLFC